MPSICRVCAEYVSCVESSDLGALLLLPVQTQLPIFCHTPPGDFERRRDPYRDLVLTPLRISRSVTKPFADSAI